LIPREKNTQRALKEKIFLFWEEMRNSVKILDVQKKLLKIYFSKYQTETWVVRELSWRRK
jgi:hypothetical protein